MPRPLSFPCTHGHRTCSNQDFLGCRTFRVVPVQPKHLGHSCTWETLGNCPSEGKIRKLMNSIGEFRAMNISQVTAESALSCFKSSCCLLSWSKVDPAPNLFSHHQGQANGKKVEHISNREISCFLCRDCTSCIPAIGWPCT